MYAKAGRRCMNPLTRFTIKGKMILLIVLPFLALLYFTGNELIHHFEFQEKVTRVKELVHLSESLSRLLHETQKERGASAGYVGSHGKKFVTILPKQRQETDRCLKEYRQTLAQIDLNLYPPELRKRWKNSTAIWLDSPKSEKK